MKKRVAILNFAGCNNYGANLTAFALLRQCGREGWDARLVDRRFSFDFQEGDDIFATFGGRHLKWTAPCYGVEHAKLLNARYDAFIVGSDQVWAYRPDWMRMQLVDQRAMYDLEFAAPGKLRIAMAASFGGGDYSDVPVAFREARAKALQLFDAVSVREKGGVEICRRLLETDAQHVLDPVFFLSSKEWGKLADKDRSKLPPRYAALCVLEPKVFQPIAEKLTCIWGGAGELPVVNTMRGSVEAWVRTLRDAEVVVTDSFHVASFAIIFRKPFIHLNPAARGTARVPSMLADLRVPFPCVSQETALGATQGGLEDIVASARSAAYTPETEVAIAARIQETVGFLHRALHSTPAECTPEIAVNPDAMRREYLRWNPIRRFIWLHRLNRFHLFRVLRRRFRG